MPKKAGDGINQNEQRCNGRDLPYPSPLQQQEEGAQEYAPAHTGQPG